MQSDPVCLLGKDWDMVDLSVAARAKTSLQFYNTLQEKYGAEDMENNVRIMESTPIFSDKGCLGSICRYSIDGQLHSDAL